MQWRLIFAAPLRPKVLWLRIHASADNLMVRPLANGYLTVTTDTTSGQARTLQGAVSFSPARIENITIPLDASLLTVQSR